MQEINTLQRETMDNESNNARNNARNKHVAEKTINNARNNESKNERNKHAAQKNNGQCKNLCKQIIKIINTPQSQKQCI